MAEPASIEPSPAACFQTGDVVVLKSGGPRMTVENIVNPASGLTSISWFVDGKLIREQFDTVSLERINAQHPIAMFAEPCVAVLDGMLIGKNYPPDHIKKLILDYRKAEQMAPELAAAKDEALVPIAAAIRNTMWLQNGTFETYRPWMNIELTEQQMWRRVAAAAVSLMPRP